ncbi:hypothetical protein AV530_006108 [Patagioenas fasciata monilis]|uniref:Uncharacterized protein n=1 Tax=Patagioenas fasciata monilis TaxID=372326 RepID=A0A1V4J9N6_PATFA|nr:hypothetical protein AV530_006108 [Patagioenas fasciata monilis]
MYTRILWISPWKKTIRGEQTWNKARGQCCALPGTTNEPLVVSETYGLEQSGGAVLGISLGKGTILSFLKSADEE